VSRSAGVSAVLVLIAAAAVAAERAPRGIVRPLDPATNPTTPEKVALGAKLFADKRLSQDGTVACATCHVAALAFTDGRPTAIGIGGKQVPRNTPTLLNAALNRSWFWDGRSSSLEDQARHPVLNLLEMGRLSAQDCCKDVTGCAEYPPLFKAAFGDETVTLQRIARAIAAYERTLLAGDAPFDRWWAGDEKAMGEAARRGYDVFQRAGCAQCHSIRQSYALFTDGDFHNTGAGREGAVGEGRDDPGRYAVTKKEDDLGAFRTPTLRNVALTAPYMHDGSIATLAEVVDFYEKGGKPNPHLSPLIHPIELSAQDRTDLVAFLEALSSPVLPQLEDCDKLLLEGRPREAFDAFRAAAVRDPHDARALDGMARAAVVLDDKKALETADEMLRRALGALSPDRARDGDERVANLLFRLGRVDQVLSRHDDATATTRQEDALSTLARARTGGKASVECLALEARIVEEVRSPEEALSLLKEDLAAHPDDTPLAELRAVVLYRSLWQAERLSDESKDALRSAGAELDRLAGPPARLSDEGALYRAYVHHRLGAQDAARAAYCAAAMREPIAEKALKGLRNLLARDLDRYRADLAAIREKAPDSPTVLLFAAYEDLQAGRLDEAERALRHRMEVEKSATAAPHYYLAQIEAKRGHRAEATGHYAAALALEPQFPRLVTEYDAYVRSRKLEGFADTEALVADYRQLLAAGPDEPAFQVLERNNLGFTLREVAASYTSRGPARIHTFPEGAPQRAKNVLKLCVQVYEEAVALIPADAASLPFKRRWDYAAVLNDTGLMHHYFADAQDFARAEELYLRAFDLTQGAYQDTYFYNLQFLYGFELTGRDAKWLELARVAKDAILKEDPKSETGFSPDDLKRRAARADFERLSAKLPH
jgi:cytochrome c peroxidase